MKTMVIPAAAAAAAATFETPNVYVYIYGNAGSRRVVMSFADNGRRISCEFHIDDLEELGPRLIAEHLAARMEN